MGKNMFKSKIKALVLVVALEGCVVPAMAQRTFHAYRPHAEQKDSVKTPKWEPHLSVSTGFIGSNYGDNRLFTSVAPSLDFRPNDRWRLTGGFRITSDMGMPMISNNRDLAPYKRDKGTGLVSVHGAAEYQVNDRLWLAAAVYHVAGSYAPFYGFGRGNAWDVSATAISAAAAFRFNDNDFLRLSFTVVRDNYGTLPFMYHDAWLHGGYGAWGLYATPLDYYRMADPFSPFFYNGIY